MAPVFRMTPRRAALFVVDDEPDVASSVADLLRPAIGLEVAAFRSAQEALWALPGWDVRALLADYRMPDMDGVRLLREAALRVPKARRILMTAYPDLDVTLRALHEARVHHVLRKPLDPDATVSAVRRLLQDGNGPGDRPRAAQSTTSTLPTDPREGTP